MGAGGGWRGPGGTAYDLPFEERARRGENVHGEADLVVSLGVSAVLDAGCGTGRVAVELARRGLAVTGVDVDPGMLDAARRKAPELEWALADLSRLQLVDDAGRIRRYDAAVLAGNVMLFVQPGTEEAVVAAVAAHLGPGGLLVAGFQLGAGRLRLPDYDAMCARAGLTLRDRWATWHRDPWREGGDYAVSVHLATVGDANPTDPEGRRGAVAPPAR